jgi:hypothetical protein
MLNKFYLPKYVDVTTLETKITAIVMACDGMAICQASKYQMESGILNEIYTAFNMWGIVEFLTGIKVNVEFDNYKNGTIWFDSPNKEVKDFLGTLRIRTDYYHKRNDDYSITD